jgi:hypothetical protein
MSAVSSRRENWVHIVPIATLDMAATFREPNSCVSMAGLEKAFSTTLQPLRVFQHRSQALSNLTFSEDNALVLPVEGIGSFSHIASSAHPMVQEDYHTPKTLRSESRTPSIPRPAIPP